MLNLPLRTAKTNVDKTEKGKCLWALILPAANHIDFPDQLVSCPALSSPVQPCPVQRRAASLILYSLVHWLKFWTLGRKDSTSI
jgi:hypothetical protein